MQSNILGLIIYTKPIKDNDLYIKILSINDEIISGFVYGGNSSKKKSTYQIGYFIEFNQLLKNNNSFTIISGEICSPFLSHIFDDKFKSFFLLSIISILNKSIYVGQRINGLFISVKKIIIFVNTNKHWISNYCKWLFYFLKLIGYEIEYNNKNKMEYFNLNTLNFEDKFSNNHSILFPFELFNDNFVVTYNSVKSFFVIFETIYKKNLLNGFNDKMPINFTNFKNVILKKLNQKKHE